MPLILQNSQTARFQEAIAATDKHNAGGDPRQVPAAFYAVRGRPLSERLPAIGGETQFYRYFSEDFLRDDPAHYSCLHELFEHPPVRPDIIRVLQAISGQCFAAVEKCVVFRNESATQRAFPCADLSKLSSEALKEAETSRRFSGTVEDVSSSISKRTQELLKLLDAVSTIIGAVGDQIKQCALFEDAETMREQARQIAEILRAAEITASMSSTRAVINQQAASYLKGSNGEPMKLQSNIILPAAAAANVINQLGLVPVIRELAVLMDFIEYAYQTARVDHKMRYRTYPEIVDSKDGLAFEFRGLTFPSFKKPVSLEKLDATVSDVAEYIRERNSRSIDYLSEKGRKFCAMIAALVHDGFMSFRKDSPCDKPDYYWEEGLTEDEHRKRLDELHIDGRLKTHLMLSFRNGAFVPFGDVSMGWSDTGTDADSRIKFLSGPNMAGKTTLMRAIGCALNMGAVGRKVCASSARMTLPDHIFDNFNLGDDLKKGLSTFKAQLVNAARFLKEGTVDSLALLDEFLNGTSPIYTLAIGWAIAERLECENRRAVIATHDPYIPFMCEKDGFEKIKGVFANVPRVGRSNCAGRMSAMSVRADRNLVGRPSIDSEALEVMKEVMDPKLVKRAHEIREHIIGRR